NAGAESIDAARESWWLALRDAEAADYETTGRNFQGDEASYRRGFEAALRTSAKDSGTREGTVTDTEFDEAFRRGYERGQSYQKSLRGKAK
ncbi:MAG: hypothetical protein M3R67_14945, partial [Acidobacteriota bacterium]|nr:hypothetical protein [Acidobacteriota bacterium]